MENNKWLRPKNKNKKKTIICLENILKCLFLFEFFILSVYHSLEEGFPQ